MKISDLAKRRNAIVDSYNDLTKFFIAVTFKLVYDRETGKPKGYGFCEYKDQETALSAMRNLNGVEIAGRTLRVDNACTEKSRMEIQSLMAEPVTERYIR